MISRRGLLTSTGGALAWPYVARAQQPGKVWRVGILDTASAESNAANIEAFRKGLRELGYVEGQNLILDYRAVTDGRAELFGDLASELVGLKVDLVVTRSTAAIVAVQGASATVPVVMAAQAEPLGSGVIGNLAHPGGNITGLSAFALELVPKLIELLREIAPRMTRVAVLTNMGNPVSATRWDLAQAAARSLGIEAQLCDVRSSPDIGPAFEAATSQGAGGIIAGNDPVLRSNLRTIIDLAAVHKLPTIHSDREFVAMGGLISYGPNYPLLYFRAASFVDRILKGARPADLPIEQPTAVEMAINLKTAKALGLTLPPSVLLRADQVIE